MSNALLSINNGKEKDKMLNPIITEKYEVIMVEDVYAASVVLKKRKNIKTIVIDIEDTEAKDWDFIYHINTSSFYQKPVIVITGNKSTQMKEKIRNAKINYSFQKPFCPNELLKSLEGI